MMGPRRPFSLNTLALRGHHGAWVPGVQGLGRLSFPGGHPALTQPGADPWPARPVLRSSCLGRCPCPCFCTALRGALASGVRTRLCLARLLPRKAVPVSILTGTGVHPTPAALKAWTGLFHSSSGAPRRTCQSRGFPCLPPAATSCIQQSCCTLPEA